LSILLGHSQEDIAQISNGETFEAVISSDEQAKSVVHTEMVGSLPVTMEPTKELNLQFQSSTDDLYAFLFNEHQLDLPADSFMINSSLETGLDDEFEYDWNGLISDIVDPLNVSLS